MIRRVALAVSSGAVLAMVLASSAQAQGTHCVLRHRIPARNRREILRKFVEERHAPAGPMEKRRVLVRCGSTTIVNAAILPPASRRRHCVDRPNACLPYQDDSVWRRYGKGEWELLGGFLGCEEFPASERDRMFKAGICAKIDRAARSDRIALTSPTAAASGSRPPIAKECGAIRVR